MYLLATAAAAVAAVAAAVLKGRGDCWRSRPACFAAVVVAARRVSLPVPIADPPVELDTDEEEHAVAATARRSARAKTRARETLFAKIKRAVGAGEPSSSTGCPEVRVWVSKGSCECFVVSFEGGLTHVGFSTPHDHSPLSFPLPSRRFSRSCGSEHLPSSPSLLLAQCARLPSPSLYRHR